MDDILAAHTSIQNILDENLLNWDEKTKSSKIIQKCSSSWCIVGACIEQGEIGAAKLALEKYPINFDELYACLKKPRPNKQVFYQKYHKVIDFINK